MNENAADQSFEAAVQGIRGSQIAEVAERLGARVEAVTEAMISRILEEVPVYRRLPPDGIANVGQLASRNCRVLSEALRTGAHLDREDLRYVAEHARERVRRGVSLESMMHAYRVGLTAYWEECIAEGVALGISRDAALELARRTSELSDDLTTHAAETFVREEARLRAVSDQAARDLLELLLRGEVESEALKSHLAAPGLDSAEQLLVVFGRIAATEKAQSEALDAAAQAISRALATGRASPLVAIRTGAVVAVAPLDSAATVAERLHQVHVDLDARGMVLFCGLSTPRAGLAGVPTGFEQAALAVSRASTEQPVISLSDLPAIQSLLLGATGTMRSLLASKAHDLGLGDPQSIPVTRETLQAFADADMNVTRAARALHVHPNTLRYRLRRIRDRGGRDPHSFHDLVDLLCLVTLLGESTQSPGSPGGPPAPAEPREQPG